MSFKQNTCSHALVQEVHKCYPSKYAWTRLSPFSIPLPTCCFLSLLYWTLTVIISDWAQSSNSVAISHLPSIFVLFWISAIATLSAATAITRVLMWNVGRYPREHTAEWLDLEDLSSRNVWCMHRDPPCYAGSQNYGIKQHHKEVGKEGTLILVLFCFFVFLFLFLF